MKRIGSGSGEWLHGVQATRDIETLAMQTLPPQELMQRAGLAVARLALAVAPHARTIWIACGPGNNAGDGLEAAIHLRRWGKSPVLTWLGAPDHAPPDTCAAYARVLTEGLSISESVPKAFDVCIDALLGIGTTTREPVDRMAHWIECMNGSGALILSVDTPSGLDADTGCATRLHVRASHTLSLLTLKPGLFTAQGRDASGCVWLDNLGLAASLAASHAPTAQLNAPVPSAHRPHASHKGSFGDVVVVGGALGMTGAALLAARAALHAGAGRVFVSLLDQQGFALDVVQPELMFRDIDHLALDGATLVCGCGGGEAIRPHLPGILSSPAQLVLDADALNAIANDLSLQAALQQRAIRSLATVLTPHPLEAARLLGVTAAAVQANRLAASTHLRDMFGCVVVLKGSGTVIAAPGETSVINATGNGQLATAGTGDVLAGMIGARWANGLSAFRSACAAVYAHGELADSWRGEKQLTASQLANTVS